MSYLGGWVAILFRYQELNMGAITHVREVSSAIHDNFVYHLSSLLTTHLSYTSLDFLGGFLKMLNNFLGELWKIFFLWKTVYPFIIFNKHVDFASRAKDS